MCERVPSLEYCVIPYHNLYSAISTTDISGFSHVGSLFSGEKQYKLDEILPIYNELIKEKDTGTFADFNEAFKTFDREGQGFVSVAELRHVLTSLGKYKTQSYRNKAK
jgi:Ca2+-binding EF-hand superfamily protein